MKNTSHTFQVMAILENTNLYFSLFIVLFSFKQLPCKSVANPIPEWENEGRQRAVTTIFVEEKMRRLFGGKRKYLYLCRQKRRLNVYDEKIDGYYSIRAMCGVCNGPV